MTTRVTGANKNESSGGMYRVSLEGQLFDQKSLQPWLKRLLDWHLVQSAGRTQSTRYFVDPGLLRSLKFTGETTVNANLKLIQFL
jgi:hypothetical protein